MVGGVEVIGETEAEHKGYTLRNIGVSREVTVYLQRKAIDGQKGHNTTIAHLTSKGWGDKEHT